MYAIANAPCSWGVDDPKNPYLPPFEKVLLEAGQAGYSSLELGPWGFLPKDPATLSRALDEHALSLVAGTLFDDLVSEANFPKMVELTHKVCQSLRNTRIAKNLGKFAPPYLVIIDFGNPDRAKYAGQPEKAPRLNEQDWQRLVNHIREISRIAMHEYQVRPVIHPHAGGCIEFGDEIERIAEEIPYAEAGLCLDTGHLYYASLSPEKWIERYIDRLDYLHFKDVNKSVFQQVIAQQTDFFNACAQGVMCPLGQGDIDYAAVKAVLDSYKWQGWITIEQERDPRNVAGSLADVTASLSYLKHMGF